MLPPRVIMAIGLSAVLSSACAVEGDDEGNLDVDEQIASAGLKRVVIARMFQRERWTIPAADTYRAAELPTKRDRRIAYVCDAIAPLRPTYVSGLVRLDADQEISAEHKEIFDGVRACIDGRVDHKVRYDVVLNALHYTDKAEGVSSKAEGKARLVKRLESANQALDPDGYFFDFFSTPWNEKAGTFHPDALLEGMQRIKAGDRFVGGNIWKGYVPKGASFVSITDRGGKDSVDEHLERLRGAGVPVLMHIRNDPHIKGSEGRRWNQRDKKYRRQILRREVRWQESGYIYMYPVFFPLREDRDSYDAVADGLIDRIKEYMGGGDRAERLAAPDGDDAAPTALDVEDDGMIEVHRAFHGAALQHLFTRSLFEIEEAPGDLEIEAEGFFSLARSPAPGTAPMNRCNLGSGWHLLTAQPACEGVAGAVDEGVIGHVAQQQMPGTVPLYRLYSPAGPDTHYTTSAAERDAALGLGYGDQGVAGFVWDEQGLAVPEARRVPIHRAFQGQNQQHLYSVSLAEIAGGSGLTLEAAGYFHLDRWPSGDTVPLHRCYLGQGWHLLTTQTACEGAPGAIDEGVLGHIATTQIDGTVPLHRMFRPDVLDHFYTVSAAERDQAVSLGYTDEGIAGYVYTAP